MALAVFDITKAKSEAGREITPVVEYTSGTVRYDTQETSIYFNPNAFIDS